MLLSYKKVYKKIFLQQIVTNIFLTTRLCVEEEFFTFYGIFSNFFTLAKSTFTML